MPRNQPRNLVFCCDGTANQYGTVNTNTAHLYQRLANDPATPITHHEQQAGQRRGRRRLGPSLLACRNNAPATQKCAEEYTEMCYRSRDDR